MSIVRHLPENAAMQSLPARIRRSARVSGHFVLRSGVLAGLEMGGIPIVTMLSQVTGLPAAFIRKEPKEYGTCRYAEGHPLRALFSLEDVERA